MVLKYGYRRGYTHSMIDRKLTSHHLTVDVDGDGSDTDNAALEIIKRAFAELAELTAERG